MVLLLLLGAVQQFQTADGLIHLPNGNLVQVELENALRCLIRTWIRRQLPKHYEHEILAESQLPNEKRLKFCTSENLAAAGIAQDLYLAGGNRVWDAVSGWIEKQISLNNPQKHFYHKSVFEVIQSYHQGQKLQTIFKFGKYTKTIAMVKLTLLGLTISKEQRLWKIYTSGFTLLTCFFLTCNKQCLKCCAIDLFGPIQLLLQLDLVKALAIDLSGPIIISNTIV